MLRLAVRSLAVAAALLVGLHGCGSSGPPAPVCLRPSGSDAGVPGPIQHVVVIMQENRSFDSYFGTYPGADGIPVDGNGLPTACIPDPLGGCQRPYHDTADSNNGGP